MLFRPTVVRDLEKADCLMEGCVVISVWRGHVKGEGQQWFVKWCKERDLPMYFCHTSGHASVTDLRRLRNAFSRAIVVPVHLEDRARFSALLNKVVLREDGEWWSVA
jgi:ribonuclease J